MVSVNNVVKNISISERMHLIIDILNINFIIKGYATKVTNTEYSFGIIKVVSNNKGSKYSTYK